MGQEQPTIFLSHASADAEAARRLGDWLERVFPVRVFVSSIHKGAEWRGALIQTIRECSLAIVLATENSVEKSWVNLEIGAVLAAGKPLIPVCAGNMTPASLPATLEPLQACEYNNDNDRNRMLQQIGKELNRPPDVTRLNESPRLEIESQTWPSFTSRQEAVAHLQRIIAAAQRAGTELCVAGVANTDFFAPGAQALNRVLRTALDAGMKARFLFLDPDSKAAFLRHLSELNRLDTPAVIKGCLTTAARIKSEHQGALQIRVAQEMPCYICLNHTDVLYQPYFTTITGHESQAWLATGSVRQQMSDQFERLWGERWVLCDLGNVLINFDHKRISKGLLKYLPARKQNRSHQGEIHSFIFESRKGTSRNMELDRGRIDLPQICREFRDRFSARIDEAEFRQAWCSIFDDLKQDAINCLRRLKQLGLKVAICSNTNSAHWDSLCARFRDLEDFDQAFLSFRMHALKTDPDFFEQIARKTRRPCEEHLLIDDLDDNLEAARASGVKTIKVTGSVRCEDIEKLLLDSFWI